MIDTMNTKALLCTYCKKISPNLSEFKEHSKLCMTEQKAKRKEDKKQKKDAKAVEKREAANAEKLKSKTA